MFRCWYHNIVPVIENEDVLLNITPEQFGLHMKAIKMQALIPLHTASFMTLPLTGAPFPKTR